LDGAAEHETAMAGRWRIHHHIHGQRDHRARPVRILVDLAEQQVHRNGHAVIDRHLVDDGEVELVEDHRLGDVRGERRMTLYDRHRARAPALVGRRKVRRAAERERGNEIDRESRSVVVIDDNGDIGLGLAHPFLRLLEAREYALPIGLLGLAVVDGCPDGGHMRRTYTCDDPGHGFTSALLIWTGTSISLCFWLDPWPRSWPSAWS